MSFAETNRVGLFYVEEEDWGVVPTGAGNEMTPLRYTGESIGFQVNYSSSQEIDPDAQVKDLVQTGADASGGVNFELSADSFDPFIQGALRGEFSTELDVSDTGIDVSGTDTIGGTGLFSDVVVGQYIRTSGFSNSNNNGVFKVTACDDDSVTVDAVLVTESAGATVRVQGSMLRNGTTDRSFSLEKAFTDIGKFLTFTGMVPGEMSLAVAANEFLGGSFSFTGKQALSLSDATNMVEPANAATTTSVMNAVSAMKNLSVNAGTFSGLIQAINLNTTCNLRGRPAVGVLGNASVGYGRFELSGDLTVYFEDGTMYDKYVNDLETDLSFLIEDTAGNAYVFSIPRMKFNAGTIVSGGVNQDVMAQMSYQALRDAATGCTFQIDKFKA